MPHLLPDGIFNKPDISFQGQQENQEDNDMMNDPSEEEVREYDEAVPPPERMNEHLASLHALGRLLTSYANTEDGEQEMREVFAVTGPRIVELSERMMELVDKITVQGKQAGNPESSGSAESSE